MNKQTLLSIWLRHRGALVCDISSKQNQFKGTQDALFEKIGGSFKRRA